SRTGRPSADGDEGASSPSPAALARACRAALLQPACALVPAAPRRLPGRPGDGLVVRGRAREGLSVLTIVMYHYVRDGAAVPARTIGEFERQLDRFAREYTVVGCADVLGGRLPDNACLLTFDDGLVEHAEHVAPALERRGFSGCFCPAGRSTL